VTHRGRRPGWRRKFILGGVALAFVATGCQAAATSTTTSVTYVAVRGGSISVGISQSPTGCNPNTPQGDSPATQLVLNAVLPSPFTISPSDAPTQNPNVITQSELINTKPETIVYTLNPHAKWSDGVPISAADFIYAWQQQRGAPAGAPGTVASVAGYRDIKSVEGSNDGRTVTVVFRTPFADWQMLFANLLPAHIMKKVGWNPSCSTVDPAIDLSGGPFVITSATSNQIDLISNPKWWGVATNSRRITVKIASSLNQLAQWMRNGTVQVALPNALTPSFLTQMTSLPDAQSAINASGTFLQLEMASGPNTPLAPDTRFAISLAIDRQALLSQQVAWALPSTQVATSHLYVQGQSGYHATPSVTTTTAVPGSTAPATSTTSTLIGQGGSVNFPTTANLTQSAALMVASGYVRAAGVTWHSAFGVPFVLHLVVDDGDPWAAATEPQLVSQLQAAGYAVTTYSVPSAVAAGAVLAAGFADLALLPRTSSPFLSQSLAWYTTLLGPPGQNGSQDWSGYDSTAFDQLVTTASQQLNPNTAATDYAAADTKLWDDMVALPLFAEPNMLVWSRSLAGVEPAPKSNSLLWYAQNWAVRVPESTNSTTPPLPNT
jgi:peptide/nickel transport system substrate-binding protein